MAAAAATPTAPPTAEEDSQITPGCEPCANCAGGDVILGDGTHMRVAWWCGENDATWYAERDRLARNAQRAANQATANTEAPKQIMAAAVKAATKRDLAPPEAAQKEAPAPGLNPGRRVQESAAAPGIDLSAQAPQSLQEPATLALKKRKLQTFSEQDSDIGNVNDMYGMKRGGVTMASRRGDGAAIRGKTKAGMR